MQETSLITVIYFSLIGGIFSLIGGLVLLSKASTAVNMAKYLTPFAAGALLAAVFLEMLPEGINSSSTDTVLLATLAGILIFFLAERFLTWFHHHHASDDEKSTGASLIIVGDTLHNILDGVAIGASFIISVPAGIATTIAVAAHEIPQEIGDFGLLLHKGLNRKKVLLINVISAAFTTLAAIVTFSYGAEESSVGVLLGLSAGFLLYIAASDIIPEIHENAPKKRLLDWQPVLLIVGVVVVGAVIRFSHGFLHSSHEEHEIVEIRKSGESHDTHTHSHKDSSGTFEIESHSELPSLEFTLEKDGVEGYNVFLTTENFKFTPSQTGETSNAGEGHAHVYINGEKYSRLYGKSLHIPILENGDELNITLNSNDHRAFTHDGTTISASLTVGESDVSDSSIKGEAVPSHSH